MDSSILLVESQVILNHITGFKSTNILKSASQAKVQCSWCVWRACVSMFILKRVIRSHITCFIMVNNMEYKNKKTYFFRNMEESKMAAAVCQNWHFHPFWHFFEYFYLVKICNFMFLMPRNPFLKDLLNFDFLFWRKGQFCSKFKRGRFSMISCILKPIYC